MANVTPSVVRRNFKEYLSVLSMKKRKENEGKLVYYLDTKLLHYRRFLLTYGHLMCEYKKEHTLTRYQNIPPIEDKA